MYRLQYQYAGNDPHVYERKYDHYSSLKFDIDTLERIGVRGWRVSTYDHVRDRWDWFISIGITVDMHETPDWECPSR